MATQSMHELLDAIRRLPMGERQQVINRAALEVEEDTPKPPHVDALATPSLIGLMADEPELIDQMYSFA